MWYANHLQVSSRVVPIVLVTPQPQVRRINQSESGMLSRETNKYQTLFTSLYPPFSPLPSPYLSLPLLPPSALSFLPFSIPPSPLPPPKWYDEFDAGTTEGLLVVGVGDYLTCFWPDLTELRSLYESLETSIRAARKEGVWERKKYEGCV